MKRIVALLLLVIIFTGNVCSAEEISDTGTGAPVLGYEGDTESVWTDGVMGYGAGNAENRVAECGTIDGGYEELTDKLEKTEQGIIQHMVVMSLEGMNKAIVEGSLNVYNKSSAFIDKVLVSLGNISGRCIESASRLAELTPPIAENTGANPEEGSDENQQVEIQPEESQPMQPAEVQPVQPVVPISSSNKVIIDTDYASDADDVVALELAMVYDNHAVIDLIGVALSTTYSRSPMALNHQLSSGGHGDVPVAMDTSGNGCQVATQYIDVMYQGGSDKYEQPVQMYRRLLASSEVKVNIITLGFLQNIEDLLNSQPDGYSLLNGVDLVREKVNTVYVVGGNATGRPSFNFYWGNNRDTTKAAKFVNANLPCRLVYIPEEMGNDVFVGGFYNHMDKKQTNIVTRALKVNNQEYGVVGWDPFGVYCMVADMQGTLAENDFILHNGTPYISDTGAFQWTDSGETVTGRYLFEKTRYGGEYNQPIDLLLNEKFNY